MIKQSKTIQWDFMCGNGMIKPIPVFMLIICVYVVAVIPPNGSITLSKLPQWARALLLKSEGEKSIIIAPN